MELQVSVALVTRNRPDSLKRCLASWRAQSAQPFEIVVSDDSDPPLRPEIQRIAQEFHASWFPGPRRGLYANRNSVARRCNGTHVFSADDDHEHPTDFLEKCMAALEEDCAAALCVGEVLSWTDVGRWRLPGQLYVRGAPSVPEDLANTWAWSDGATICPREVFDSGLCFSEAFRFGWSYLEFGCLLHSLGQRIRVLADTGVIHHLHEVGRSYYVPTEECAASYFTMMMLALVYQPTNIHRLQLMWYFLREVAFRPTTFCRAFPWALREMKSRKEWLRNWRRKSTRAGIAARSNSSELPPCSG